MGHSLISPLTRDYKPELYPLQSEERQDPSATILVDKCVPRFCSLHGTNSHNRLVIYNTNLFSEQELVIYFLSTKKLPFLFLCSDCDQTKYIAKKDLTRIICMILRNRKNRKNPTKVA